MINTNNIYVLFHDVDTDERAYMPSDVLVENGTPITDTGEDMEYFGYTPSISEAEEWGQSIPLHL